jgi:gliding-associated putative ABC transporter substrate-binding component GldG
MVEKNPAGFRQKKLAAAVLLEGSFTSTYANRQPPAVQAFLDSTHIPWLRKATRPGKMIVAADGELIMNEVAPKTGPSDMGSYRFSDYRFDNKAFLLNCMEYLTDRHNLLAARTKRFDNHLLDPERVENERGTWQFINIGIPVISIILLGLVFFFIRKRKYG